MIGLPLPPVDEIEWIRLQEKIKHQQNKEDNGNDEQDER